MQSYWTTFEDGTVGCCDGASDDDALRIARHIAGKKAIKAIRLPRPAAPEIWRYEHPVTGKEPSFCHQPHACAGKGRCQANWSCID